MNPRPEDNVIRGPGPRQAPADSFQVQMVQCKQSWPPPELESPDNRAVQSYFTEKWAWPEQQWTTRPERVETIEPDMDLKE